MERKLTFKWQRCGGLQWTEKINQQPDCAMTVNESLRGSICYRPQASPVLSWNKNRKKSSLLFNLFQIAMRSVDFQYCALEYAILPGDLRTPTNLSVYNSALCRSPVNLTEIVRRHCACPARTSASCFVVLLRPRSHRGASAFVLTQ